MTKQNNQFNHKPPAIHGDDGTFHQILQMHLLVDWGRDSLILRTKTLAGHPSHLLHHLEPNVLNGQFEILFCKKVELKNTIAIVTVREILFIYRMMR